MRYVNGNADAGDPYIGLDRFGRVVDQRWIKDSTPNSPLDRFQYGYDRNSNRLYRDNLVNNNFDELYHANGASAGYDNLNQLAAFRRGVLSDSDSNGVPDTVTTASRSQSWALDEQGNWDTFTTDGNQQTREHNYQNQVTDVGASELAYDNNGSTLTDENGRQYIYDAWNRLVEMKTSGGTQLARFSLDALNRRVQEDSGGVTKDFYYSDKWQVLEEQHDGDVQAQYVWSPVYVDALVLRDRDTGGDPDLDERLYVQQDANWNVTAVTNPSGAVQERYIYDPYGQPTALQPDWTDYNPAQPEGDYDWLYLHQGGRYFRFDANAGTYQFRHRELSATLGRWLQQDPIGFGGEDVNLYRYVSNSAVGMLDPTGLKVFLRCWDVKAGPITVGKHCGVIVVCEKCGKTTVIRYDGGGVRSPRDPADPTGQAPLPDRDTHTEVPPLNSKGPNEIDYAVDSPWKDCENEVKCFENAYSRILQLPYGRFGPNSNTYAHALLTVCQMKFRPYIEEIPGEFFRDPPGPLVYIRPTTIIRTSPPSAVGWNDASMDYGPTVEGGPAPDWK